jgi:hypothetical protein
MIPKLSWLLSVPFIYPLKACTSNLAVPEFIIAEYHWNFNAYRDFDLPSLQVKQVWGAGDGTFKVM